MKATEARKLSEGGEVADATMENIYSNIRLKASLGVKRTSFNETSQWPAIAEILKAEGYTVEFLSDPVRNESCVTVSW